MEPKEITPEWVKENLCMDDGNDITECYSDETIDHICWVLNTWEDWEYVDAKDVLNQFHLIIKNTGIYFYNKGLIDNLFETLKWCIEQKHIELI